MRGRGKYFGKCVLAIIGIVAIAMVMKANASSIEVNDCDTKTNWYGFETGWGVNTTEYKEGTGSIYFNDTGDYVIYNETGTWNWSSYNYLIFWAKATRNIGMLVIIWDGDGNDYMWSIQLSNQWEIKIINFSDAADLNFSKIDYIKFDQSVMDNFTIFIDYIIVAEYSHIVENENTGKLYDEIQDAINAASNGDTIKVHEGTYGPIVINKEISLIGDPIIDGKRGIGIKIEANNTIVENFTISNCSIGIYVHNASFTIQNITINNVTIDNSIGAVGNGTIFNHVNNSWINNTRIYNANTFAIKLNSSTNITIENCNWSSNQNGLVIAYSHYNIIQNNEKCIDNSVYGIYLMASRHNKLLNTDFISGGLYGIYLSNADNNSIENCELKDNSKGIFVFGDSTGNIIRNNTLSNSQWDINVIRSPNNVFLNNTVSSYPTTFDINAYNGNFTVAGVDAPPADPEGFANISAYLNITGEEWLNISIYYNDSNVAIKNESTIKIWKYNTSWYGEGFYSWRGIDVANNKVFANITSFSIFAPLQDIAPPKTTKVVGEPSYKEIWVNSSTPIWLNATDNDSGVNTTYYRIWNGIWHPANLSDYYCGNKNITNINGTYWYIYRMNGAIVHAPIYFHGECIHYLEYFSVDFAGNEEEIKNQTHFVDNSPPELTKEYGEPYYTDGINEWVTSSTPIYINATDLGEVTKFYVMPTPWPFAEKTSTGVLWKIKNYADKAINITVEVNRTSYISLDSLTWDYLTTTLNWEYRGQYTLYPEGGGPVNAIQVLVDMDSEEAALIRYTVAWEDDPTTVLTRFIGEAVVAGDELQHVLVNFDVLNNLTNATYDFELEFIGREVEPLDYYDGWGTPPEIRDIAGGTEIIWADVEPVEAGDIEHFGLELDPSLSQDDFTDIHGNWTIHCGVGSYIIYYRVYNESADTGWLTGEENESVSFTLASLGFNGNCTHYIEYYAIDDLGNNFTTIAQETVYVDNIPPSSSIEIGKPQYRYSLCFDGVNDRVIVPDATNLDITDEITIEAWVKIDSYAFYPIVDKMKVSGGLYSGYRLFINSYGRLGFQYGNNSYNLISSFSTETVPLDEWVDVVVTLKDGGGKFYINGMPAGTVNKQDNIHPNDRALGIGYSAMNIKYFKGCIDDVLIYNRALTDEEVLQNHAGNIVLDGLVSWWKFDEMQGNIAYDSIDGNDGTIYGATYISYINYDTPIWINATDAGLCNVGSYTIHWKIWNITGDYIYDEGSSLNENVTLYINEECQHIIGYWVEDDLGNRWPEDGYYNITVYVDNTPPSISKEIGEPKYTEGGEERTIIFFEDFEDGATGWTIEEGSNPNGDTWAINYEPDWTSACLPGGASGAFMEFDDDDYGSASDNPLEYLISPVIDCTNYENVMLDFDGDFEDWAGHGWFRVDISNDYGATWHTVLFETEDVGGWNNYPGLPIDISAYADGHEIMIRFVYSDLDDTNTSGWGWGCLVDNINVTGIEKVCFITEDTPIYINVTDAGLCAVGSVYLNVSIYSFETGLWTYYETNATTGTASISFTIPEECKHWINITAMDDLGNVVYHNQTVYVDDSPPIANVNDIIPYCQWISEENPLTITVNAHDEPDCAVGIANITLYYRFARYNHSFSPWISLGTLENEPWQWQFTAPNGSGYYQFYTIAYDKLGNHEPLLNEAIPEAFLCVPYNHTLHLYHTNSGWNMITIPVKNESYDTAEELGNYINSFAEGACTVITKWDSKEQKYISYIVGFGGTSFEIKHGEGIFIFVKQNVTFYMRGCLIEYDEINLTLYTGYNLLGWANLEETTADEFGSNINNCTKVGKWDAIEQKWPPEHLVGYPMNDFAIHTGDALLVFRTGGKIQWDGGRSWL